MKHFKNMDIIFLMVSNLVKKKLNLGKKIERIDLPVVDKEIHPPGTHSPVFNSFASSKNNKYGLNLSIFKDKKSGVGCIWNAEKQFEVHE